MKEYQKPVPEPDRVTAPFWEAARAKKLLVQRCPGCGAHQFFPQAHCRECLSDRLEWVESTGKGTVYSFTVIHRPPSSTFERDVPYTVALVDLDEGCRMISNIVDVDPQAVRVGMSVEVVFEEITANVSLPKFRPTHNS